MSEPMRCPSCGASNAAGATWCGQCYTRFDTAAPMVQTGSAVPEPAEAAGTEAPPRLELVHTGPIARTKGRLRWTCPACATENSIDASVCVACSTPMAALFGAEPKPELRRIGGTAVGLSAILPGLGHAWAGRIGDALARMVLFGWTLGVGLMLVTRRSARAAGTFRGIGAVFVIAAIAVWIVSFLESVRLARGDASGQIPSRALMWASVALTAVLFIGLAIATQSR